MLSNSSLKWTVYITLIVCGVVLNYQQFIVEQWMRFGLRHETIVVSLTTTPHRINNLRETIVSLRAQNASIKTIYINIPYIFKRDNTAYVIPHWLSDDKHITILRGDDYGPATKILGTLKHANLEPDTIIISVDDDSYYPKNLVLQLAYKALHNPRNAIGICGTNIDYNVNGIAAANSRGGLIYVNDDNVLVSALQGVSGIAYRRSFFDDTVFDVITAPRECINSDDLYLSFYLARHNIARQTLKNRYINARDIKYKDFGRLSDALRSQYPNEAQRHANCIAWMYETYPNVHF